MSGFLVMYIALICYPYMFFAHSVKHKNYIAYSTTDMDRNIYSIVDKSTANLSASEINDTSIVNKFFLCDNYSLYFFFSPKSRKAFANNYSIIHNIYLSRGDVKNNEACKMMKIIILSANLVN